MFNIDSSSAVANMPTPSAAGTAGWFSQSSPFTVTTADWANSIQAELLNVLSAAEISPDKSSHNQLVTAIQALISNAISGASGGGGINPAVTYYVSSSGLDTNIGTQTSPLLTIQQAIVNVQNFYATTTSSAPAYIYVADGTYGYGVNSSADIVFSYTIPGNPVVYLIGNQTNPQNCILIGSANGLTTNHTSVVIKGFQIQTLNSWPGGNYLSATSTGHITCANIQFGLNNGNENVGNIFHTSVTGQITILPPDLHSYSCQITTGIANGGYLFYVDGGKISGSAGQPVVLQISNSTWNPLGLGGAYVSADFNSALLDVTNFSFTMILAGSPYDIEGAGVITGTGGNVNFFPTNGSHNGYVSDQGTYE